MSGVHEQIFAKLVSPRALLAMSQRVFNTYYDTGRFEIVHSERGHVHARSGNCVGWDANGNAHASLEAHWEWAHLMCRVRSTRVVATLVGVARR